MGNIAAKLVSLRRRERLIALAWGIARLLLVVFAALAIACYADWRIDMRIDTPMWLRVGMLAGQIVLAATLLWLWVVRPLIRRRTEDDVALFVDGVYHSFFRTFRWLAVSRLQPKITVPPNIHRVHTFAQQLSRPHCPGYRLADPERTQLIDHGLLQRDHIHIDEAPEVRDRR